MRRKMLNFPRKILVFGLPGSGKTSFADDLRDSYVEQGYQVRRYNADVVREEFNDWDFSPKGRERQARRMHYLSTYSSSPIVIVDFVAPTEEIRSLFYDTHVLIWMNTIRESRFEDTNKVFETPLKYNYEITRFWK